MCSLFMRLFSLRIKINRLYTQNNLCTSPNRDFDETFTFNQSETAKFTYWDFGLFKKKKKSLFPFFATQTQILSLFYGRI